METCSCMRYDCCLHRGSGGDRIQRGNPHCLIRYDSNLIASLSVEREKGPPRGNGSWIDRRAVKIALLCHWMA